MCKQLAGGTSWKHHEYFDAEGIRICNPWKTFNTIGIRMYLVKKKRGQEK